MKWKLDDSRPIWPQLKEQLMKAIVAGQYPSGEPFPTVRDLSENAGVNRNTMQRALSELESVGLLITNRTSGRTVTSDSSLIEKIRIELANENVESFLGEMASLGYSPEDVIEIIKGGLK